jgi:hypothetical protein
MSEAAHLSTNARKQAKHRAGVKAELKAIRSTVEDLSCKLDAVLAAKLIRKSITQDNHHD